MKTIITTCFILLAAATYGQTEEKIKIPKGIVYNYCDPAIVDKAKEIIKADLSDTGEFKLSGDMLIVGPVLWRRFKDISELKNIPGGNVEFHVDKNILTGKMTQKADDTRKVWKALQAEINSQPYVIRKLNEKELVYYWSVISFDIDEPLLIVETKEHKYILNILKEKMTLLWLDEAPE